MKLPAEGCRKGDRLLYAEAPAVEKRYLQWSFSVRGATIYKEPGVFISFEETEKELTANVASLGFDLDSLIKNWKKIWLEHIHIERARLNKAVVNMI